MNEYNIIFILPLLHCYSDQLFCYSTTLYLLFLLTTFCKFVIGQFIQAIKRRGSAGQYIATDSAVQCSAVQIQVGAVQVPEDKLDISHMIDVIGLY
jgi:hypothetical protein